MRFSLSNIESFLHIKGLDCRKTRKERKNTRSKSNGGGDVLVGRMNYERCMSYEL